MATTAKKTASKTTAKKTAARKTTKQAAASKAAPKAATAAPKSAMDEVNARLDEAVTMFVRLSRDAAFTSVGMPLVVQDRLSRRSLEDVADYSVLLDEAKRRGNERVAEVRGLVEPYAQRVAAMLEPVAERIEDVLPKQVKDAVDGGRDRVRELLAV